VGGDPFYLKFWVNRPPLERNSASPATSTTYALTDFVQFLDNSVSEYEKTVSATLC